MITKESIENLKSHLDVVDVVSQFVELKKSGANFKACCPFHGEDTPSFVVSPQKQIYHCFGCLPPFQEILTPAGYRKIEDIKVGDIVFTMKGYPTKVIETVNHTSEFDILGFQTSLTQEVSFFTQNHDMLVVSKQEAIDNLPYLRVEKNRPLKFYGRIKGNYKKKYSVEFKDIYANDVKVGDYFLYPVDRDILPKTEIDTDELWDKKRFGPDVKKIKKIKITKEFMWLAGLYIAEGSSYRGGIRFSLSINELDFATKIIKIIQKLFKKEGKLFYPKNRNSSLEITISSTNLQYIFEHLFKKSAKNKQYPHWFNYLSRELKESLFQGLMDGDGCYKRNTYDTVSETLANQILDLAISLKKIPSCRINKEHIDKKGVNHQKSYTIYFKKRESIESFFEEIAGVTYLFLKVKKIQNVGYEDLVYDLTVEDNSHTFLSKHFAVGNCGVGGDSIKFVMEYEKLSYPEAIEKLASMYNVSLQYDNNYKKIDTNIISRVNEYYNKLLTQNQTASEYLKQRGISDFSIEKFEIGYASNSSDTINFLKTNFLNLADAKELGIIDSGQNGLYARFIERITFPIYTINGNIVGFGGRTISGHNAKYVNSPQTKLFNKSRLLYGYNLAKESIYKQKAVIVTEGYLDVVMLHQAGFNNTVATLGTALTKEHLPLLKRGEPRVIVAYDGDKAGLNAAYKASLLLSNSNFLGGVVIFEQGLDPADMVKNNKIDTLNSMFTQPTPFIPFVIDYIIGQYNVSDSLQKEQARVEVNSFIQTLNPIVQEEYQNVAARKLNVNINQIQIQHFDNQRINQVQLSSLDIAELSIIKTILDDRSYLQTLQKELTQEMFETHGHEYNLLLNTPDDPTLRGLMLNEKLIKYTKEQLKQQLTLMLVPYYNKKLQHLTYDNEIDFKKKSSLIRDMKYKLNELKRGKLIDI